MKLQEILEVIEEKYSLEYACDWDNSGLQTGDREKEIGKVYIALDATDEVITHAKACGADLLLTHHPLIFSGIKSVTTDTLTGRKLLELIASGIAVYSMHTNYDTLGMADLTAAMLEMTETFPLETVKYGEGIGRVGKLSEEMTVREVAALVKERFGIPDVHVFGDLDMQVRTAALLPGSGKSCADEAFAAGAEVMITGDIDHHTGIDMADRGMAIIDAGHYGIEHVFVKDMETFVRKNLADLEVETEMVGFPFVTI